jgi:glycosyltransferase domain-containing protein
MRSDMKSSITIVVPTYNRPKMLDRLLSFLHSLGCPYPVLVLDGSSAENKPLVEKSVSRFSFVSLQAYPSELHAGLRFSDGLNNVSTEYVVFCADDDFVFPKAIASCVRHLDEHRDYAAATGEVRALIYGTKGRMGARAFALPERLGNVICLDQDQFILRSQICWTMAFVGSVPLFYSVRRTAEARHAFSMVTPEMKYSSTELVTNASLLISGKVAILPELFGLRDYASEPVRDVLRDNPVAYFEERDLLDIREKLLPLLQQAEQMTRADAEYCIDAFIALCKVRPVVPLWSNPVRNWVERKYLQMQRVLTFLSPSLFARLAGVDKHIAISLSEALSCRSRPY